MKAARLALCLLVAVLACRGRPAAPIVNWHAVDDSAAEFAIPRAQFEQELDWLVQNGYRTIPLGRIASADAHAVVLTFDDGSADALTTVLPALRARRMTATFFIATGFVGRPGYLSWDGVRTLAGQGMEIGSHSVDHARLPDLPETQLRRELVDSRVALEAQLRRPVDLLAWPFNAVRGSAEQIAREAGYRLAVAGAVHGSGDPLRLYRFSVTRSTTLAQFADGVQRARR